MQRTDFARIAIAQIVGGRRMNDGQTDVDQNVDGSEFTPNLLIHILA